VEAFQRFVDCCVAWFAGGSISVLLGGSILVCVKIECLVLYYCWIFSNRLKHLPPSAFYQYSPKMNCYFDPSQSCKFRKGNHLIIQASKERIHFGGRQPVDVPCVISIMLFSHTPRKGWPTSTLVISKSSIRPVSHTSETIPRAWRHNRDSDNRHHQFSIGKEARPTIKFLNELVLFIFNCLRP
jgi:hypothetical protein